MGVWDKIGEHLRARMRRRAAGNREGEAEEAEAFEFMSRPESESLDFGEFDESEPIEFVVADELDERRGSRGPASRRSDREVDPLNVYCSLHRSRRRRL